MTRAEDFMKKAKCKNNHCSSMSNSAWCDLNSKGDILKLHDLCSDSKCKSKFPSLLDNFNWKVLVLEIQ